MAELTNRELDAFIAENVMGMAECSAWRESNLGSAGGPCMMLSMGLNDTCPNGHGRGQCFSKDTGYPGSGPAKYTEYRNAAALVLEKVSENAELKSEVCHQAALILLPVKKGGYGYDDEWWSALTATPRQLMDAVKAAWENRK